MAIVGLTDRTPSFKEIGRLRLGIPKAEALKSGPKEISHFRPDFRPDALDAQTEFIRVYGPHPAAVNIRLPFPNIERCWDAFYEVYNTSGMLGMADGQRWLYLRNNKTSELLVRDGVPSNAAGLPIDSNGMPYMPFNPKTPVYSYKSKKEQDVAVYARPTGRLKVLVPELKRAAYIIVITHSVYNIMRISEQLAGAAAVAQNAGMSLPMVPMVLSRRKESISVSFSGKKKMQEHYLLNIEIDPLWMEAQFRFLNTLMPGAAKAALPAASAAPSLQLPSGDPTPEDLTEGGDEIIGDEPSVEEPVVEGPERPYLPAVLKEKLAEWAKLYEGQSANGKYRGMLANTLNTTFEGDETKRYEFSKWAFGAASLNDVADAMVLAALKTWMEITGWNDVPSSFSIEEARAGLDEALRAAGQMKLI